MRAININRRQVALLTPLAGAVLFMAAFAVCGGESAKDAFELIMSELWPERQEGQQLVLSRRQADIEGLVSIVRQPIREREPFYIETAQRNVAIILLGRLRAKEAVPHLIPLLVPQEGQDLVIFSDLVLPFAGTALVEIGLPAVGPLVDTLGNSGVSNASHWDLGGQCVKTLVAIEGAEDTKRLLSRALGAEEDATKSKNLSAALALLEAPTFSIGIMEMLGAEAYKVD